jgi:hypothetical protein
MTRARLGSTWSPTAGGTRRDASIFAFDRLEHCGVRPVRNNGTESHFTVMVRAGGGLTLKVPVDRLV